MKYLLFMLAATFVMLLMMPFWALVSCWSLNFKEFNNTWTNYKRSMAQSYKTLRKKLK